MKKVIINTLMFLIIFNINKVTNAQPSILSTGEIFQVEINSTGIHKLDFDFFKQLEGVNINDINPNNIAIYGNGGHMVPELNSQSRINDLYENAIYLKGGSDNKFDNGDYILFYAEGPKNSYYIDSLNTYKFEDHLYESFNYYYIKIKDTEGKRITTIPNINTAEYEITNTEKHQYYNDDNKNLLGNYFSTHGSGKDWYGESFFSNNRTHDFSDKFDFKNLNISKEIFFKTSFASRSESTSKMIINIANHSFTKSISTISKSSAYNLYAVKASIDENFLLDNETPVITYEYPAVSKQNEAWLDYIEILSSHYIRYNNKPLLIQNQSMKNYSSAKFSINEYSSSLRLWNITDPLNPNEYNPIGNEVKFETNNKNQRFLLFDINQANSIVVSKKIKNQNLHGATDLDMLIVYHKDFKEEADRLAQHRRDYNQYNVLCLDVSEIYNEFSSGKCDPSAIRDYARFLKIKYSNFKYLLLFGDGSYDYRGLSSDIPKNNFIPVFETKESLHPIKAFPSDDYFALLDDKEGSSLKGQLDLAIGRLPVNNQDQAKVVVDKIIKYETDPTMLGAWRLNLLFCADDEDSSSHLIQTESIANSVPIKTPGYNIDKVYFDAYEQVSTPGGHRYPAATKAINNKMYQGLLLTNYLGHGGPTGWSQERVLGIEDINSWQNKDRLTVMVTATCSFAGYEDPKITTAGEAVLLNPYGGAVALLTTTRAVFSHSNKRLAQEVYNHVFMKINGEQLGIGEVLSMAKNKNKADTTEINARKFTLLGDPAMRLAVPKHNIITTSINGHDLTDHSIKDTLKALSIVKVSGDIVDDQGQIMSNFNGTIEPTIYDKPSTLSTLKNDAKSKIVSYNLQQNILFKGSASVVNGHFEYEFQMPKDIKFNYGYGKISHYAFADNMIDAMGSYDSIMVGGTDTTPFTDKTGPEISLFMNDENFGYGGFTNTSPVLLVKLSDQSGINVTGTSIGHDISGVLDGDINNTIIMNQYYKATTNSYRSGSVQFPLSNLSKGSHTLKLKAWDIHNNPSEKEIQFNVIDINDKKLYHVLNYPNPFVSNTNFRFEHGLPNIDLDIICHIFTVTGKLVKTIEAQRNRDSQSVVDINWDGTDDYNSKLGKGIYLYKIKVKSEQLNISKESNFEKLVIL